MADAKPQCRLYLQMPEPLTAKLESQLAQALATASPACVLLCNNDETAEEVPADRLIDLVQGAGVACLIETDIGRAERLGADGAHIPGTLEAYEEARRLLGESANIGVGCGLDRHAAMQLAEAGADYVAFGPQDGRLDPAVYEDIIAWWSEIFVVPCVAWNVDNPTDAERLAVAGADFVATPTTIWQEDNAVALIGEIDSALRRVRSTA